MSDVQMQQDQVQTATTVKERAYLDTDRRLIGEKKTYLCSFDNVRGTIGALVLPIPPYKDPNNANVTLKEEYIIEFTNGSYTTDLVWLQQFIEQHPYFLSGNIYDAFDGKPLKGKEHAPGEEVPRIPRDVVDNMVKASGMTKVMLLEIAKSNGATFTADEEALIRSGEKEALTKAQIGERIA